MNAKLLALCGLVAVFGMGVSNGVLAQAPGGRMAPQGRMGREKHPELRASLMALRNAKGKLEHANHDFDGHRVKAIEHINKAIREVEQAMASDKH